MIENGLVNQSPRHTVADDWIVEVAKKTSSLGFQTAVITNDSGLDARLPDEIDCLSVINLCVRDQGYIFLRSPRIPESYQSQAQNMTIVGV